MHVLLLALFIIQGAFIIFDETFHWKRGLGTFERRGHILDAALFAAPLFVAGYGKPSPFLLWVFILLSVLSCLVVTKDEWIHSAECKAAEQWVHSVLFLFHSAVLVVAGVVWTNGEGARVLSVIPWLVVALMVYQITYWLVYASDADKSTEKVPRRPEAPIA